MGFQPDMKLAVERYRDMVFRVAFTYLRDPADADSLAMPTQGHSDLFAPKRVIGARRFSDGKGAYAYLSPFGIRYEVGENGTSELATRSLALDFIDGTSKTITLSDDDESGERDRVG